MAQSKLDKYVSTIDYSKRRLGLTAAVGALAGISAWLLSLFLQWVLIEPVFCRSADSFGTCANGGTISIVIALVIVNILGLFALIRLGVYRPLLVVIATLLALTGTHSWLGGLSWYEASLWYGLLFGLSYSLFAWIARLKSFATVLVVLFILIISLRIFMTQL